MKLFRKVAYGIIVLCIIGCIIILTYSGGKDKEASADDAESVTSISSGASNVVVSDGEVTLSDVLDAAGVMISDAANEVASVVASVTESHSEEEAKEEPATEDITEDTSNTEPEGTVQKDGEISYSEIVKLQEKEAEEQFKRDVNSAGSNTVSGSNVSRVNNKYSYAVNKYNGMIHKKGCLVEPNAANAFRFDSLSDAIDAGYTEKCKVCSP